MRIKEVKPAYFVSQMRCDRCGAEARHDEEDGFNNFLQIEFDSSWGSSIGDGIHVEVDLCHACLKQTLGPWLRLSDSAWTGGAGAAGSSNPDDVPVEVPHPPKGMYG